MNTKQAKNLDISMVFQDWIDKLQFENWDFYNFSPIGLMPYSNIDELKDYMSKNYTRESTRVFD